MTYVSGGLIQATDYNGFVSTNANANVNDVWGTGSGDKGWGQSALATVSATNTITATQWGSLVNTLASMGSQTNTAITARSAPTTGQTIGILSALNTDLTNITTNRAFAAANGSQFTGWTGTNSKTAATSGAPWSITFTNTVTFASANAARWFFNAGGRIKLDVSKTATGATGDPEWNDLANTLCGDIFFTGIAASKTIAGAAYTGTTKVGGSGTPNTLSTATGFYALTPGAAATIIYKQFADTAPYKVPTIGESFSKIGEGLGMGDGPASFDTFKQGASDLFAPGPDNAQITSRAQEIMRTTPGATLKDAMAAASKELSPGFLRTYGPATVAGIGAISAFGGFKPSNPDPSTLKPELLKSATQRIQEQGKQKEYYVQGLPGVKYDEKGAPIYGEFSPLPTYEAPNFAGNYGGGITSLPNNQMYTPPPGVVGGNAPVYQPYNTASMYSNLVPRRYEEGGTVTRWANILTNKDKEPTAEEKAAADKAAADKAAALAASQAANREAVRRQEEQQRAAGFGNAYANINAGLAYNAPSSMPAQVMAPARTAEIKQFFAKPNMTDAEIFAGMQKSSYTPAEVAQATGVSFGDVNRRYNVASQEAQFNPAAQAAQYRTANEAALGFRPATAAPVAKPAAVGNVLNPAIAQDLMYRSMSPGGAPTSSFTQYGGYDAVNDMATKAGFQPTPQWMNSYKPTGNGIASLAAGGYPRRTGQISGPGTPTSDSIPAMLSDGEFVMTEKAVRGAGNGSRREGARKMYALMHQLERNAARG